MWGIPHNTAVPRITASERDATRRRLVDAGKSEFAARGLAGARFDQISLAAGHAKGTIYNYFDTKEHLFFTIVEDWCDQLVAGFVPDESRSAGGDLLEIAQLDTEIARKDPDLARVVINQLPGLATQHASTAAQAIEPGIELIASVISSGQQRREITTGREPHTLARLFLATLSAIEQEALDEDTSITLDDVVALTEELIIQGLRR